MKKGKRQMSTLPAFSCQRVGAIDTGSVAMGGHFDLDPVQHRVYDLLFLFLEPGKHNELEYFQYTWLLFSPRPWYSLWRSLPGVAQRSSR